MMQKKSGSFLLSYGDRNELTVSFRLHQATRPHIDLIIGDPNDEYCPDFYTTSKQGRSIEELINKSEKEWVRDGGLHPCSMLDLPVGHSEIIPKGQYGAGKWKVIAKGISKRNGTKKSFDIELIEPPDYKGVQCDLYAPFGVSETWALQCGR